MSSVRRAAPLALLALLVAGAAAADGFLPVVNAPRFTDARVLTAGGRWLLGEVRVRATDSRGITRVTVIEAGGTRHKLDAHDVERIVAPLTAELRRAARAEATSTVEKVVRGDAQRLASVSELSFDSVPWPDETRRVILQRVDSGLARDLRVYAVETWREAEVAIGDVAVAGGEPKAFVVVRSGHPPVKVSKRNYDERFTELFGACPALVARVPVRERELKAFAEHLRAYGSECAPADDAGS